ncbi:hypothetical protein HDU88_001067 [Geranomyces variabilis]|nr:hypothetical protein HDU88_001067 [Geranomyces variabilis]
MHSIQDAVDLIKAHEIPRPPGLEYALLASRNFHFALRHVAYATGEPLSEMLGRMDISEVLDFDHGALEQAAPPAAPPAALPVQVVAVPPGVAVPPPGVAVPPPGVAVPPPGVAVPPPGVAVPPPVVPPQPCPWPPPDGDDIQLLRMIHNMVDVVLQLEDPEPQQPYQSVLTMTRELQRKPR